MWSSWRPFVSPPLGFYHWPLPWKFMLNAAAGKRHGTFGSSSSSSCSINLLWHFLAASALLFPPLKFYGLYNPSLPLWHLTTFTLFYFNVRLHPKEIIVMESTVSNTLFWCRTRELWDRSSWVVSSEASFIAYSGNFHPVSSHHISFYCTCAPASSL